MRSLMRFLRNDSGSITRHFATMAVVIGLGSLALASMLDRATRKGSPSAIAFMLPEDPSRIDHAPAAAGNRLATAGNLDMMPVGSVKRPIVLDPCTGAIK